MYKRPCLQNFDLSLVLICPRGLAELTSFLDNIFIFVDGSSHNKSILDRNWILPKVKTVELLKKRSEQKYPNEIRAV
jgi:hypothetical protein